VRARRAALPPLQSVMELTSAFQPPTRGQAPVSAQAAPPSAGARTRCPASSLWGPVNCHHGELFAGGLFAVVILRLLVSSCHHSSNSQMVEEREAAQPWSMAAWEGWEECLGRALSFSAMKGGNSTA
jgi:hypothetical protein